MGSEVLVRLAFSPTPVGASRLLLPGRPVLVTGDGLTPLSRLSFYGGPCRESCREALGF
jgi:hypothetical protein